MTDTMTYQNIELSFWGTLYLFVIRPLQLNNENLNTGCLFIRYRPTPDSRINEECIFSFDFNVCLLEIDRSFNFSI
jgi:hypothetical protein